MLYNYISKNGLHKIGSGLKKFTNRPARHCPVDTDDIILALYAYLFIIATNHTPEFLC
ncbi:MAG: hypothetical protein GXP60_05690 [Epsilonproteobacteria bacterium]|nr:hypothetical protein [Campylobacterota bacterium]